MDIHKKEYKTSISTNDGASSTSTPLSMHNLLPLLYSGSLGHFGGKILLLINNLPWEYNYCTDTLSEYYF